MSDELMGWVDDLIAGADLSDQRIADLERRLAAKDAALKVAKEALIYYAEQPPRHTYYIVDAKDRSFLSDMTDWGVKAQLALAALEAGKEGK